MTSGQINRKVELINLLQILKKDLNLDHVRVSLPEEKAYLFTSKTPIMSPAEVRSAIESKIEENVPVSPLELTFDYKLFERPEKDLIDVVVSALPLAIHRARGRTDYRHLSCRNNAPAGRAPAGNRRRAAPKASGRAKTARSTKSGAARKSAANAQHRNGTQATTIN